MTSTRLSRPVPAARWLEALPLGNGRIGAMAWGDPRGARFSLNESTWWSGAPQVSRRGSATAEAAAEARNVARQQFLAGEHEAAEQTLGGLSGTWSQAFQPIGELVIHLLPEVEDPQARLAQVADAEASLSAPRELDLTERTHRVRTADGDHVSFVSRADEVLAHALPLPPGRRIGIEFTSPQVEEHRRELPGGIDVVLRAPSDAPPAHAPGSPAMQWGPEASRAAISIRWQERNGRCLVVCSIVTSWQGLGRAPDRPVEEILQEAALTADAALAHGEQSLTERHLTTAPEGADTFDLRLGSGPQQQLLADVVAYGRYLAQSSTRVGLPPPNLQGIWNAQLQPPWSSNFTVNINLEMNHWAAGVAHLPESAAALEAFVGMLRDQGQETARRLYDADGWVLHHNTDAWGYTDPVAGDVSWAIWPLGGLWLELQLDDLASFRGTDPTQIAAERFPAHREAARFALDMLHAGQDGQLVTFPSTSPENRWLTPEGSPVAISEGTGMDRWLVRETFAGLLDAAEWLERTDDPVVARSTAALEQIPGPRLGTDGRVLEWHAELPEAEPHHRHVSHLAFVHPGTGVLDAQLERAAARSLEARGDEATGWSLVWKLCLWARLRRPDRVQRLLKMFLRDAETADGERAGLYPNLFSAHPPFQIDANLGIAAAVAECLVQSHRGEIELLPACAPMLADGTVHGLRARPGLAVDMTWRGGTPEAVQLSAVGPAGVGVHQVRWRDQGVEVAVPAEGGVRVEPGTWTAAPGPQA